MILAQTWRLTRGRRWLYFGALACVLLGVLVQTLPVQVLRVMMDAVLGTAGEEVITTGWLRGLVDATGGLGAWRQYLWIPPALMVLFAILQSVLDYCRGVWLAKASESIACNLRDRLFSHLQILPYSYHVRAETGDLIQRCTSDVESIRRFLSGQLVDLGRCIFGVFVTLWIMLQMNGLMTLVSMAMMPVLFLYSIYFYKLLARRFKLFDEAEGALSSTLQENLSGVRVVKAFARQEYEIKRFDDKNREARRTVRGLLEGEAWFWPGVEVISGIQVLLVVGVGTYFAVTGRISLGTLIAFSTYIFNLLWPIRQLGRILADLGRMQVAWGRIQEILHQDPEPQDEGGETPIIRGAIDFEHVHFRYGDGPWILDDLSLNVQAGETVAILGATGSGKSSIAHLLQRLFPLTQGHIRIDGQDIDGINRDWLRSNVGLVLQEPFLFSKSIMENLRLGNTQATDEQVYQAADTAAIHAGVMGFEKGYDTLVGERGVTLSGGQKQRLTIARTLLMDPPILVFDDSLSAVDAETDAQIRTALRTRRQGGTTTIIISHRLNTLREADRILVIEGGRVAQQGTHDTLVGQPGLYQRVWNIQTTMEEALEQEVGV